MTDAINNNNMEIILPKIWFLILGAIVALLIPPIGLIWGVILLIKKYRIEGIIFIALAIISIALGAFLLHRETFVDGQGIIQEGQILPEELRGLPLEEFPQ